MHKTKPAAKILVNGIDLTPFFRNANVSIDQDLRSHFSETRKVLDQLERARKAFDDSMQDLEADHEIHILKFQNTLSRYNRMFEMMSKIVKSRNDMINCIIRNMR